MAESAAFAVLAAVASAVALWWWPATMIEEPLFAQLGAESLGDSGIGALPGLKWTASAGGMGAVLLICLGPPRNEFAPVS